MIFQHVLNFAKVLSFDEGGRNSVWPTCIFQKRGPTGRKSKNEHETFNLLRLYLKCNFFQEHFSKICKTLSDKLRTTIHNKAHKTPECSKNAILKTLKYLKQTSCGKELTQLSQIFPWKCLNSFDQGFNSRLVNE